jgi:MFS family permease
MKYPRLPQAESREWAASWQIPLVGLIGMAMSGTPYIMLGTLMTAIAEDTGWTRLQISSGTGIMSAIIVLLAPIMGMAIDRFGSRRIGLPGLAMFCLALASLALAGPSQQAWWAGWSFVAIAALFIKSTVWTAAIVTRFSDSRGLAIAVALTGSGVATFSLPLILTLLQQSFGWRGAVVGLAALYALLSLPLAWRYFYDAADQRRREKLDTAPIGRSTLPGLSPREIFRSRKFFQIGLSGLLAGIGVTALTVHFIPLLKDSGFAPLTAATIASGIGLATIFGRLTTGLLLDRFKASTIGFVTFSLPVLACMLLLLAPSIPMAFVVAVLIGFAAGAEFDVLAYLAARQFGVRHYGLVFGTVVGLLSFGAGLGPMLGAHLFDLYGSYRTMLLTVAGTFSLSAILIRTLGPYPVHRTPARDLETRPA